MVRGKFRFAVFREEGVQLAVVRGLGAQDEEASILPLKRKWDGKA